MRVTSAALVAHRFTFAPSWCRTSKYQDQFIPNSVSLWNNLAEPVFDGMGLACFKSREMLFYWPKLLDRFLSFLYPEWTHRQGGCLVCCGCTLDSSWGYTDLFYARCAQGVLPVRVGGATSQLILPSLTPLSVAGCGWLNTRSSQLGCFSTLLQVVDNWPHILWQYRFSTGRLWP